MKLTVKLYTDQAEMIDVRDLIRGVDYIVKGSQRMKLLKPIYVKIGDFTRLIPNGTEWDGASIPRAFWALIGKPTQQQFALASLVHDYLYMIMHDRDEADTAFRKLLDWAGVNGRRVALMWGAVRVGGHMFYASRAKNNRVSTRMWRGVVNFLYGSE